MIIQSKRVWINQQFMPAQCVVKDGLITNIYPYGYKVVDLDVDNKKIVPGFIDIHIHGAYGVDTNDASEAGLKTIMSGLVSEGVTAFCPTTVTQAPSVLIKALKNVASVKKQQVKGAQIIGVHFEGPFLNKQYKGAQPEQHILDPDLDLFKQFETASENNIKVITMACELDQDFTLTKYCFSKNIAVSIGHSAATYEQAMMAIAHGAKGITHIFNGMSGYHHRDFNLAGAAHRVDGVYGEIIGDGNHVVWPAIYSLMMAKGKYHNILISDALSVKGSKPGLYELGGHQIEVRDNGSAYLKGTNTLSGSTLKINQGIKNLVEFAQVPFEYALLAATTNPATYLQIADKKGKIAVGYDADLVVLDDDYQVLYTFVGGEIVYKQ